jgi:hypothetical protein
MAPRTFRSLIFSLFLVLVPSTFCAEQPDSAVRFSQQSRLFRIDAGETTYAFGVNEKNELRSIYWGGRLSDDDTIPSPKAAHEVVSFDSPGATTLQEFSGSLAFISVVSIPPGNTTCASSIAPRRWMLRRSPAEATG